MKISKTQSRREWNLVLAGFAVTVAGQANSGELPSKCYQFSELPVKANPETHNETRAVFDGETHSGDPIEMHITTLAPGQMPHAPHRHIHDEMIMLQQGRLEVTIAGKTTTIGPGSVAYARSNEQHGWKNAGDGPAQYFVLAIGRKSAV